MHDDLELGSRESGVGNGGLGCSETRPLVAAALDESFGNLVGELDLSTGTDLLFNGFGVNVGIDATAALKDTSTFVGALIFVSDLLAVPESPDRESFLEFLTSSNAGRLRVRSTHTQLLKPKTASGSERRWWRRRASRMFGHRKVMTTRY
ncbi:hypothetical protein FOV72_19585 [Gordonia rubripertincta]|uniref:hypothetical protein n=1 Tax=Gordonia rubripertincta TaxID=36822 RepID=UPI00117E0B0D|nr:hypothetical protein [Gordonia rubripertincta]TSD93464.1 hypothetical protein FOV72_19585 [Gordonia rubripertincta]